MKVFILGAGASFGSQDVTNISAYTTPLTEDFLDERYLEWAKKVGLSDIDFQNLRKEYLKYVKSSDSERTFEDWLTEKWMEISSFSSSSRQDSSRKLFGKLTNYIWYLLKEVSSTYSDYNHYRTFISNLDKQDEPYGLISFNYDTLVERALQSIYSRRFNSPKDYFLNSIPLIKPHGSVNWFLPRREKDPSAKGSEYGFNIETRLRLSSEMIYGYPPILFDEVKMIDPSVNNAYNPGEISQGWFNSEHFYPLILIPLKKKLDLHVEGFNKKMVDLGKNLLQKADKVYLVGYRAQDEYIYEIFNSVQPGTKLKIVGKSNANEILTDVTSKIKTFVKEEPFSRGFAEFVKQNNLY